MKKGFTLIEVLGVIILLGLLALIVFPSVVNQMKKIDSNINESTKKIIYMAADEFIADNKEKYQDNIDCNSFIVIEIKDLINDGYLANNIDIKNYKYVKINIENGNSNSYKMLEDLENHDLFDNGEVIYFNPTTGKKCNENDYKTNLNNYSTTNTLSDGTKSPTGLKNGCMKWYAFNDSVNNGLVNLMLDHNTTAKVAWNTSKNNKDGMKEIVTALKNDTDSWHESLTLDNYNYYDNYDYTGYKARIITADEIAKITGADIALEWSGDKNYISNNPVIGVSISHFFLDGSFGSDPLWQTQVVNSTNKSKYNWLNNYINACLQFGCDVEDTSNAGYWTSTPISNDATLAFHVGNAISISGWYIDRAATGIRPVIMLNKEIFE